MIRSKKELKFYIMADRIMNGCSPKPSLFEKIIATVGISPPHLLIIKYLKLMRKASFYENNERSGLVYKILSKWYNLRYQQISMKLGFSIGKNVFGYGLVIPHYGTIVVNGGVKAGNYCVLHTSTCIGGANKVIGDGLYLSTGAKIMGCLTLGDGVSVAAGSVVKKSAGDNVLLAGMPAVAVREHYPMWYERDGDKYMQRVKDIKK